MFKIVKNDKLFNNLIFPTKSSYLNYLPFMNKIISNRHFNFSKSYRDSISNLNPDDPFPKYDKKDFYDEHDLIINIGEKETYKGMLIICPTPIGNLNDISIRQYEALKNGDLLACEDTRKTGKLLELLQLKKMKEKFYSEFGVSFEDFINRGGLDMTDHQIKSEFLSDKNNNKEEKITKEDDLINKKDNQGHEETSKKIFKENFHNFYETEADVKKHTKFEEKLNKIHEPKVDNKPSSSNTQEIEEKIENKKSIYKKPSKSFLNPSHKPQQENSLNLNDDKFFDKLNKRLDIKIKKEKNPFGELDSIVKDVNLNFSEADPKEFINQLKEKMEPVAKDYYTSVKDSEDFLKRKLVIENSSDDLKEFIEPLAEEYDDKLKLSYKFRTKARFIMGMTKKYEKKKKDDADKSDEDENKSKEEILEEEMSLHMGLEDNFFGTFKKKIKDEKEKKGRGLLIPFNQENEEAKIPKLIRAMKMGLRVVLVSDAGTPTISDPGYKLVREAAKNGIIVEPLPGPSAVLTALSACALPTDKFMFVGFLPKTPNEKISRLEEIKKMAVTTVLFESPNRIHRSIETLIEIFGPKHEIYIGLELTKKFEKHIYGSLETVKENLNEDIRGEITMVLSAFQKSREDIDNEKFLNDEVKLEALDFAKKVNKVLDLSDKQMRNLLIEICDISSLKANKIVNSIKHRESSITTFLRQTGSRVDTIKDIPIDENLKSENEGEGKLKNLPKIIRRNRSKEEKESIVNAEK